VNTTAKWIGGALLGVIVLLLAVGLLSSTLVRHTIQIVPASAALAAVAWNRKWAPYAALAIFAFWLIIMLLIWFWLIGIAAIVTGTFSAAEVVLTVCIGASCVTGIGAWYRGVSAEKPLVKVAAFIGFAAAQVAAMWLSLQPTFENR